MANEFEIDIGRLRIPKKKKPAAGVCTDWKRKTLRLDLDTVDHRVIDEDSFEQLSKNDGGKYPRVHPDRLDLYKNLFADLPTVDSTGLAQLRIVLLEANYRQADMAALLGVHSDAHELLDPDVLGWPESQRHIRARNRIHGNNTPLAVLTRLFFLQLSVDRLLIGRGVMIARLPVLAGCIHGVGRIISDMHRAA